MPNQPDIAAAGAVVLRGGDEVLLVHRPKYDDWSFPKGKRDRGETLPAAAVREVTEETGLDVRLGRPLGIQRYDVGRRGKVVHYWVARVAGSDDVAGYTPNTEIDEVCWVRPDKAVRLLSYDRDRETLAEAIAARKKTRTLVVLRHARARSRSRWRSDDRFRTLLAEGERQAERLRPLLAAYGVRRLVSSSSTRCVTTLVPYADLTGRHVETDERLEEEEATQTGLDHIAEELLTAKEPVVVCTHRPVLPGLLAALGVRDPGLDVAQLLVVHHRKGVVVATETYAVS